MTKFLILNVGWTNKGNVALVKSTIDSIKKFVPDAQFTLVGPENININGFNVKKQAGSGFSRKNLKGVIQSFYYLFLCIIFFIFRKLNTHFSFPRDSNLFNYYNCDIVVNSGGDHLSGEYGFGTAGNFINLSYCILLGKPVILYGESLGYFKNSLLNNIAKFILNKTKLILVRDEISYEYISSNKINNPKVYITADPAFLLTPVPKSTVKILLSNENVNELRRPLIGINTSGLISKFMAGDSQNSEAEFVHIITKAIDNLIENLDATVILIPHVYSKTNDDRIVNEKVYETVKNKDRVNIIKNEYSPEELKGIIGMCDLFIGARMHTTIASASMLVPTVGIAYSHKMYGIIGKMLGQEEYIIDIKNLNYDDFISIIYKAWNSRDVIKRDLEIKIPHVKENALLNGQLVKEIILTLTPSSIGNK